MSTPKHITDDAELAKNYIVRSSMSDEYKRIYLRLINVSTLATNGITPEEKIQKMTECIQLLAITQGMYLSNIDQKIQTAIDNSNKSQCISCKAMKHANEVEKADHDKKLLDEYLESLGIKKGEKTTLEDKEPVEMSWQDVIKQILLKPYLYVVLCLISISPYGVEIVKTIMQFFNK